MLKKSSWDDTCNLGTRIRKTEGEEEGNDAHRHSRSLRCHLYAGGERDGSAEISPLGCENAVGSSCAKHPVYRVTHPVGENL